MQWYFSRFYPTCQDFFAHFAIIIGKIEKNNGETEKMKPLKEKISITIDWDILEKIKEMAEKDDRSLSQYINIVLKRHVGGAERNKDAED